jgi:DNA-directed RNA polymerase specialized sigma24 family protein
MPTFVYDPRRNFSGWLRTVWHNAWQDFINDRTPGRRGTGDSKVHECLLKLQGGDLAEELADELEREFEREVLHEACPVCNRT